MKMNSMGDVILYTAEQKFDSILEERKYLHDVYNNMYDELNISKTKKSLFKFNIINLNSIYKLDKKIIAIYIDLLRVDADEFATIIIDARKKICTALEELAKSLEEQYKS